MTQKKNTKESESLEISKEIPVSIDYYATAFGLSTSKVYLIKYLDRSKSSEVKLTPTDWKKRLEKL